jgi:2-polyprenyl-3-methyl-5-hydroxy-6-metoxy-1,4-benzoquinol methylase
MNLKFPGIRHSFEDMLNRILRGRRAELPVVQRYVAPGSSVLDYGSGSGEFSEVLRTGGYNVIGYEPNPESAETARMLFGVQTSTKDTFAAGTFDAVCCMQVLQYVDDPAAMVARMVDLLKPNGILIISKTNPKSPWRRVIAQPEFELYSLPVRQNLRTIAVHSANTFLRESDLGLKWLIKIAAEYADKLFEAIGLHVSLYEIIVLRKVAIGETE